MIDTVKNIRVRDVRVDVPEGKSGVWSVEKFTVSEADSDLFNLRASFSFGGGGRPILPGEYTKLTRNGSTIMSDTPAEIADHSYFVRSQAKGHVLINGLGLGWVIEALFNKKEVKTITVIEKSFDVINLVAKHYNDKCPKDKKIWILQGDALDYKAPKGKRYDAVWHDIWDNICADNLKDMHKLHRKYGRRSDWQGSWCRYQCEQANKQSRW
jgi:hypothetical protein